MSTSAPKELPARAAIPASPTPSPKTPGKSALMRGPSVKRVGFSPDALTASMNNVSISGAAGGKPGDGGVKLPPIAVSALLPCVTRPLKSFTQCNPRELMRLYLPGMRRRSLRVARLERPI